MKATGLPARVVYSIVSLALGGEAGFWATLWLLPKAMLQLRGADTDIDGYELFQTALAIGAGVAFTAFLVALTLPWKRHRRRSGRRGRIAISCVFVVLAALAFAGLHHRVIYDVAFAAWLAYVTAYSYVRYGVLDSARRSVGSGAAPTSADVSDD